MNGAPNISAIEKSLKSMLINDKIISGIVAMYIPILSILFFINIYPPNVTFIYK